MKAFRVVRGAFDRFIIVHPEIDALAWSGLRWVRHAGGVPTGGVQVCNFASEEEALSYTDDCNFFDGTEPPWDDETE